MSGKQHVDAKVKGYDKPVFPARIDDLNHAYDQSSIVKYELQKIGGEIVGFLEDSEPVSSDSYTWFGGLKYYDGPHFRTGGSKRILVALPWAQDWERTDGVQNDRSIAFYTFGGVAKDDVEALCEALLKVFGEH